MNEKNKNLLLVLHKSFTEINEEKNSNFSILGRIRIHFFPEMDPRNRIQIQIQIQIKMKWIHNTDYFITIFRFAETSCKEV